VPEPSLSHKVPVLPAITIYSMFSKQQTYWGNLG